MFALISPNEPFMDANGVVLGSRVVQVQDESFPIASPLFWIEIDSNFTINDKLYYKDDTIHSYTAPVLVKTPGVRNIDEVEL